MLVALALAAPAVAYTPDAGGGVTSAAEATVQGRAAGSGAGAVVALTGTQLAAILPTATGSQAGVVTLGVDAPQFYVLAADFAETASTLTTPTGLSFSMSANTTYYVEFRGNCDTTATTNGCQWQFTASTAVTHSACVYQSANSTSSAILNANVINTAEAAPLTAAVTTGNALWGWCLVREDGTPGTLSVQIESEVGGNPPSITLRAGSFMMTKVVQ